MPEADEAAGMLLAEDGRLVAAQPSILGSLSEEDRRRVEAHGERRAYARDAFVFRQGDPHDGIVVIERGLVRSFYVAPHGRELTLAYWRPGNFVGGPSVFGGGRHIWSAIAARPTDALYLRGDGFRALARETPDLALAIIDALAFKAQCYCSLAQMLGTRSFAERLAHVLLHMLRTYGVEDDSPGVSVAASFTHAEIATLIGATRQWVTISLNRLQKDGVLSQRRGVIRILKPQALAALAARDVERPGGDG